MKQSPGEQEQKKLLGATRFSAEGFLGTDGRTLEEIIAEDTALLEKFDIAREQVAETLEKIFNVAKEAFGAPVEIFEGITACYHESMGKIPSPFRGEGLFEKGEVEVTGPANLTIFITALGINLIRQHTFFQGRGCRYRIEPQVTVDLFKLTK